jgi:hypothetical protein
MLASPRTLALLLATVLLSAGCPPPPLMGPQGASASQSQPSSAAAASSQPEIAVGAEPWSTHPADAVPQTQRLLAPTEMLAVAIEMVKRGQRILERLEEIQSSPNLQPGRRDCIGERVIQAKGNVLVAKTAIDALTKAVTRSDAEAYTREYTRVSFAFQHLRVVGTQAEDCLMMRLAPGETETSVNLEGPPQGQKR